MTKFSGNHPNDMAAIDMLRNLPKKMKNPNIYCLLLSHLKKKTYMTQKDTKYQVK